MTDSTIRQRRPRSTRRTVHLAESVARTLITVGGIGTIASVTLIFLFLVSVALPLFRPGTLVAVQAADASPAAGVDASAAAAGGDAPQLLVDEYLALAVRSVDGAALEVLDLCSGQLLERHELFETPPTAGRLAPQGEPSVFGFADGSLRTVQVAFATRFLRSEELPESLAGLPAGSRAPHQGGVLERTSDGLLRHHQVRIDSQAEVPTTGKEPIRALASSGASGTLSVAALDHAGALRLYRTSTKRNLLTGEETVLRREHPIAWTGPAGRGAPDWLELSGLADNLFLIWRDGFCERFDLHDPQDPQLVERVDLVGDEAELTVIGKLIGGATLVTGDSWGRVHGWFRIKPDDARTGDGAYLVRAKELARHAAPVTALAPSQRTRLLATADAEGGIQIHHMTSQSRVAETRIPDAARAGAGVSALCMAPKDDALIAFADGRLWTAEFHARHPEASLAAVFTTVWYEGSEGPTHVWQSTGGSDAFEPKLGLVPLIFGTLKATFYTMLFGAPLALLAALFTSQFLHPRLRGPIKSTIEMMASLPSVVLGFLAAIVVAPFIEPIVSGVLALFVTIPLGLLIGAHLWQLVARGLPAAGSGAARAGRAASLLVVAAAVAVPIAHLLFAGANAWLGAGLGTLTLAAAVWRTTRGFELPLPGGLRLLAIGLILPAVAGLTISHVGPWCEQHLFAGDFQAWLGGEHGEAWGGWFYLLLPLAGLAVFFVQGRMVNAPLVGRSSGWSRTACARASLFKFLLASGVTLGLAYAVAHGLQSFGFDPRGGGRTDAGLSLNPVGSYVQRNALIVGFIMGFAVVPIIYTIAEDALSSVPTHLRLASLGAGATPWQTAMRVIVPTAMSGLFSALMIGLGRAVGETMIVLMATGNTPILEANIFNGFRTLSANIAVELPEAVRNSTHYRTLFLAALVLFAMTFAVNTLAEIVRQHFRKRAFEL